MSHRRIGSNSTSSNSSTGHTAKLKQVGEHMSTAQGTTPPETALAESGPSSSRTGLQGGSHQGMVVGGSGIGSSAHQANTSDLKRQLTTGTTATTMTDDGTNNARPGLDRDLSSSPLARATTSNTTSSLDIGSSAASEGGALRTSGTTNLSPPTHHKSKSQHNSQTRLTKALLSYLSFFRVVQPLVSISAFGTITPVLSYFRSQTIFPTIQATLYLFTATLACCSLFFSIVYVLDVLLHKPLFWPFTNRHFRQTSKARIGGDMIVCMVFCGLWFLSLVGLVIDTLWVDCGRLTGLESVFYENGKSLKTIKMVCQLEKATLGLAVVSWACWMGVLLVLLYGHFWKRRQIIAARLRDSLSRRTPSSTTGGGGGGGGVTAGVSSAVSPDAGGPGQSTGSSISGRNGLGLGHHGTGVNGSSTVTSSGGGLHPSSALQQQQQYQQQPHSQQPSASDCGCQNTEGEVGLTGIICRYDDDQSSMNPTMRRTEQSHSVSVP